MAFGFCGSREEEHLRLIGLYPSTQYLHLSQSVAQGHSWECISLPNEGTTSQFWTTGHLCPYVVNAVFITLLNGKYGL